MPEEAPPTSVVVSHEEILSNATTTMADLSVEENAGYAYRSMISPADDMEDSSSSAVMLEVKSDDGDKSVPKEGEVSREISMSSGVEVGVEVAAAAEEAELATAGEWCDGTRILRFEGSPALFENTMICHRLGGRMIHRKRVMITQNALG